MPKLFVQAKLAVMGVALLLGACSGLRLGSAQGQDEIGLGETEAWAEISAAEMGQMLAQIPPIEQKRLIVFQPALGLESTELRWAIDPAASSVGADGVLRYVVVATAASGQMMAMYEGLRCQSAEYKTYARSAASGPTKVGSWQLQPNAQWKSIYDGGRQRHAVALARLGFCESKGPNYNLAAAHKSIARGLALDSDR